jgi:hypothetical protein
MASLPLNVLLNSQHNCRHQREEDWHQKRQVLVEVNGACDNLPHIVNEEENTHQRQTAQLPKELVSFSQGSTPFVY